ncbi:hypothetical protein ACP4OV_013739 [Aristida adscensionis]
MESGGDAPAADQVKAVMMVDKVEPPTTELEIATPNDEDTEMGTIMELFETPSGFSIFSYGGIKLIVPGAIKDVWSDFVIDSVAQKSVYPKGFQTFEDKANAINSDTGVNQKLATMIRNCVITKQKLAVGNPEYKNIIERNMGISCLCNDVVMELMWGLKYQMKNLVPGEELELTNEDKFHM